ncbi:MAG: CocE/NonD family hydrolase, partial [Planctomycetota bacterium]
GPEASFGADRYIFVNQDVRGCYMSEGEFIDMRPQRAASGADVDESTDTFDTIEWLLENIDGDNGRVGMYGTSYPGFYAAVGMVNAHPALKAVSPQAPIADWYFDDFHHHGAFFLPHAFNFIASFGKPRPEPTTSRGGRFDHGTPDGYQFFLDLGPLKNANERYFHGKLPIWNDIVAHPDYDEYWQARNLLPHLENVAPAVMTVGGWFDAEDLYGPLQIYRSIEQRNPDVFNVLVMGPWRHGGWHRGDGSSLGNVSFGGNTSAHFLEHFERPFFESMLKGTAPPDLPEAMVFETGANRWQSFDEWPPAAASTRRLYFGAGGTLSGARGERQASDVFISDPAKPVPFTEAIARGMTREYMTDDQRFAARRPDVLVYQTDVLTEPVTIAGPIIADLWVSTTGGDADWIVKLIDVLPGDAPDTDATARYRRMGGYQQMVRSEVIRGRYRNGYDKPEPFRPGRPTSVVLPLQDVLHTFQPGHRIMVQVQSTWFPLVDRNPQSWVENIFEAEEDDFIAAEHGVFHGGRRASHLRFGVIDTPETEAGH